MSQIITPYLPSLTASCPCTSGKLFGKCCGRFIGEHGGQTAQFPKTPEQLMRSRFCAYKLGGCGEYLLATWHPKYTPAVSALSLSTRELDWQHLEIIDTSVTGDRGTVEFKAWFSVTPGELAQLECMHERSAFIRAAQQWQYTHGQQY